MTEKTGKTIIYIGDASALNDDALYEEIRAAVSEERREKADAMRYRKGRNLSFGVEWLLIQACRDFGVDYSSLQICSDSNGKPYFAGNPTFEGEPLHFNLSHSGERVMCAMSTCNVGCDVELVRERSRNIAERFFTADELALINGVPEEERLDMFYRLWTLKESFMKCTGLGMRLPLDRFAITMGEDGIGVRQTVSDSDYKFFEHNIDNIYRYACCVEGKVKNTDLNWKVW